MSKSKCTLFKSLEGSEMCVDICTSVQELKEISLGHRKKITQDWKLTYLPQKNLLEIFTVNFFLSYFLLFESWIWFSDISPSFFLDLVVLHPYCYLSNGYNLGVLTSSICFLSHFLCLFGLIPYMCTCKLGVYLQLCILFALSVLGPIFLETCRLGRNLENLEYIC